MNVSKYKEKVQAAVVEPMLSFMEGWDDCDYTAEDVERCKALMNAYLDALAVLQNPTDETIME